MDKKRFSTVDALAGEVLVKLEEVNYQSETIANYRRQYDDFLEYVELQGTKSYSLKLSRIYLLEIYDIDISAKNDTTMMPAKTRSALSKMRILDDYYLHGVIIAHPNGRIKKEALMSDYLRELLCSYVVDCETNEQSAYSIKSQRGRVRLFLEYLESCNKGHVSNIDALAISDYLKTILSRHEKSVAADLVAMRSFFRWLYREEITETDWSLSVPKAKRYNYPDIPSVWKKEDVIALLGAIDRAGPVGKRDFAILSLATKLGMRSVDIRFLRLRNLDFAVKKISFSQHKTGNEITFPMTDEIGWALADWLKNGRPKYCSHDFVFSSIQTPFGQLSDFNRLIVKYVRAAGLSIDNQKHHGMHSLRHTLASTLLEQGVALPLITDVLGHMDPKSTSIYLHCDIEGLRRCALDPDREVENA